MQEDTTSELVEMMFKIFRLMKGEMSYSNNLTHLSVLQIQALIFLNQNKKSTMSDIAQQFSFELPSATSLINKLCDQNLVKRYEDAKDRRLVRITLTADGKKLMDQAVLHRRKKLEKILSYLPKKEQSDLLSIMEVLHDRMTAITT